jgi:FtsP/CotA-like multicopper oxidase with cupredoxin domain
VFSWEVLAVKYAGASVRLALVTLLLVFGVVQSAPAADVKPPDSKPVMTPEIQAKIDALKRKSELPMLREAAAENVKLLRSIAGLVSTQGAFGTKAATAPLSGLPGPGGQPDYFGFTPNWAFTPPIRKFVDTLPGLGAANANNLGNFIPVAKPDTTTYPGCDYYEIELREYVQQMHSDLPATTLRGYVQVNNGTDAAGNNTLVPDPIHYLGPFIQATKDRPVRVKFTNMLPTGVGGDLFLPVDTTVMGAGATPTDGEDYTQNRATIHLHGGKTVWISDGTPHQWITPAGELTSYPKGVSVKPVPDMPDPGDGSMTFFYSNQQSARLLWFHDHTYGLTRLNVYAGMAGGYLLTDDTEQRLIRQGLIPVDQIPLVIQDKTFVDADTIGTTDPTWNAGTTPPVARTGDLWFPHVYMPNQNPYNGTGGNAMGRWDYGLWFWPPTKDIPFGTVDNPYYDPVNAPWEPPVMPGVPKISSVMEAFADTPMVNGTPYPTVTLQPKSYRLRILNAANDRTWNLQMYQADPTVWTADGRSFTEVKMVPAAPTAGFPALWPVDGRPGGVPDPKMAGPDFIQIGTEGGFLPAPTVVKNQPVDWNLNMKTFTFGNVSSHALVVAPGERADVIVDFSRYAGRTLILYNDAPAAFPANDPRNDYFTGAPDNRDTGGAAPTEAGFGPNTRTVMQIKIVGKPAPAFNLAKLQAAFASTPTKPGVFAESQDPIIVTQQAYDSAYATSFPRTWPYYGYVGIQDTTMTVHTVAGANFDITFMPKGMHDEMGGAYDEYGRMAGKLGMAVPNGTAVTQGFIQQTYIDPPTELLTDAITPMSPVADDGTQIWKITHNGVDTHPIHFHLFDVQLINRVGWDGALQLPDENELGWKETVRLNPLQDTIVALRPVAPKQPFGVPESVRLLDPTQKPGPAMNFTNLDPLTGNPKVPATVNAVVNFGWEYMWHCHILSHEEMEMMRPIGFDVAISTPDTPTLAANGVPGEPVNLLWTDGTPPNDITSWGSPFGEIGFRVERTTINASGVELTPYTTIASLLANVTRYRDATTAAGTLYRYKVVAYNAAGEAVSVPVNVAPPGSFASYTISPYASAKGTISPSTTESVAPGGSSATYAIVPAANARILDVLVDGTSIGTSTTVTFTNVQRDHALWALFGPNLVPVTLTTGANGTITPAGIPAPAIAGAGLAPASTKGAGARAAASDTAVLVPDGTRATIEIQPKLGYGLVDVLADGVSVGPVYTYTFADVTIPHTLTATFEAHAHTITPSFIGPGSISPSSVQTVVYGGGATFSFNPAAGNRITGVLVNGVSVGAVASFSFADVTDDSTVAVTFAPRTASSLTISSSTRRPRRSRTFTLRGSLRPVGAAGGRVSLQVWGPRSHVWRTYWTGPVDAAGSWAKTYRPSSRGSYHFRATYAGTAEYAGARSRTLNMTAR